MDAPSDIEGALSFGQFVVLSEVRPA